MKLKLLMNRFVEIDSIEVPIQVTTQFDPTGVTQMKKAIDDVESSFKKLYFNDNSSKTTIPFAKPQSKSYSSILSSLKARADSRISDYYNISPNKKYDSTLANLKEQVKDYKVPVTVKDLFSRNDETIFDMTKKYDTLIDKFKDSLPTIQSVDDKLKDTFRADQMTELQNQTKEAAAQFLYMNKELDETGNSSKRAESALQRLSKLLKSSLLVQIQALAHTLRRIFHFVEESFVAAGDYVESINLYTMSVGEYATAGQQWAEKISNALYLDTSEIYQYTGQFYNLTRGLGATAKAADLMSRNLTQLTYDMSSYLNIDVSVANNKLMSAMSGQTKAVTSVGIAVQAASLQELAYSLGIDKAVESMTQAEKTYLRYIQIMRTTTQMQGDLGRTIITPTNTMRLLRTQLNLLSRAIGQVFTPIIMNALPYVIAFTQSLTELATWLAGKMGYRLEDYLAPADSVKTLSDNFEDLGDAAKGAGDKINRTLAPFDELNVVQKTTSGSGVGVDDSVLDTLEQYLTGYDMLEFYTTQMKDKINSIKNMLKDDLLPIVEKIGTVFLSWEIASSVVDFFKHNEGLLKQKIGLTLMLTGIALTWQGQEDIADNFWKGFVEKLAGTAGLGVGTFMYTKNLGLKGNIPLSLSLGVTGISLGLQALNDASLGYNLLAFGESLGSTIGIGIATGIATANPLLGLAAAGVTLLTEWANVGEASLGQNRTQIFAMDEDAKNATESLEKLRQKHEEVIKQAQGDSNLVEYHQSLWDELKNITDENGKVQSGYEDRAKFITGVLKDAYGVETDVVDGVVKNYEKLTKEMDLLIAKKKLKIWLDAYEDEWADAIKNQTTATDNYNKALAKERSEYQKLKNVENQFRTVNERVHELQQKGTLLSKDEKDELEKLIVERENLHVKMNEANNDYKNAKIEMDSYKQVMDDGTKSIMKYENLLTANTSNSVKQINAAIDDASGFAEKSMADQLSYTIDNRDSTLRVVKEKNGEITENDKIQANSRLNTLVNSLKDQSKTVDDLTPEVVEAWKTLAKKDKNAFENGIKDLPEEVRKKLTTLPTIIQNDLYDNMTSVGAALGKAFGNGVSKNMKINGTTFNETLTEAIKNVKIPRWLKDTPIGKMASSLGFQFAADGGMFNTGEMFIAREAGPELVGKIGNKTAVANNDQITTAMTNAMIVALDNINTNNKQPIQNTIYIGARKVFDGMNDYVDSENDRYGTNYVRI